MNNLTTVEVCPILTCQQSIVESLQHGHTWPSTKCPQFVNSFGWVRESFSGFDD